MDKHVIETDLLVAGGGMAGICAAIAAARRGIKVVLVQDRSVLGGNASSEIRMHIVGADNHGGRKGWRESGIIEELRLEDAVRNPQRCYPFWDIILYEKVIAEPNITLLLDTDVVGVDVDREGSSEAQHPQRTQRMYEFNGSPGRIKSARAIRDITEDEFEIRATYFADCTGDGRLGFEAGADFRIGRESKSMHGESLAQDADDTHTLGSSILLTTRRVDHPVPFIAPPWVRKFDAEKLKVGRPINSWEYGFWWIEWGGQIDSLKDHATTIRHELYAISLGVWDYVKNSGNFPESANWTLDWIGAVPGKRESRRFLGPHILTQQDVQQRTKFPDEVAYGGWPIDLHPFKGIDAVDEPPFTPTHLDLPYAVPLRCYFSRNIENLFFAGRNISATHVGFATTRVMATCAIGGEAVGVAAAMCRREGITPSQLVRNETTLRAFQQDLLSGGATLLNVSPDLGLVATAKLSASSSAANFPVENLRDGWGRDEVDPNTGEMVRPHSWRSGPVSAASPQWVELAWDAAVSIRQITLDFDSGFQRELLLSASDWSNRHVVRGPQPETVRDYVLEINGERAVAVEGNYQRHRVHALPGNVLMRTLRLIVTKTNGSSEARVFWVGVR
jgi:FAD dependent oxidoreductase